MDVLAEIRIQRQHGIADGDNTDQLAVIVDNRQRTATAHDHLLSRFVQGVACLAGQSAMGHDINNFHRFLLNP